MTLTPLQTWLAVPAYVVIVGGLTCLILLAIKAADRTPWVRRVNRQFAEGTSATWVGPRQQPEADRTQTNRHTEDSR